MKLSVSCIHQACSSKCNVMMRSMKLQNEDGPPAIVTNWKMRRRRWILRLMAAAIILLVVVHRANRYTVVNATDTMSATAGKTHRAHLHPAYIHMWCAVILFYM